jgi:hypothetical protein
MENPPPGHTYHTYFLKLFLKKMPIYRGENVVAVVGVVGSAFGSKRTPRTTANAMGNVVKVAHFRFVV